jgi:hypothetical protein
MELWRRVILVFSFLAAVALFSWVSLKPVFVVKAVDFAKEKSGLRTWVEREKYLAQLPPAEFIKEITQDNLIVVEGSEWEHFFSAIRKASTGERGASREWMKRIPGEYRSLDYFPRMLFFSNKESPLNRISAHFEKDLDEYYLVLADGEISDCLNITYRVYTREDFHFGSGFTSTKPPAFIFHPLRKLALLVLLAGLLFYIFWPMPKRGVGAVCYPRWRMVMGDIVSLLVIVPFFFFSIVISGGTLQAFYEGIVLMFVFFIFLGLGLWLVWVSGSYAQFSLLFSQSSMELVTLDGKETIPFDDIEYYQPLVAKPPRWLVISLWMGALANRGAGRIGGMGRAMILGGTSYGGMNIVLKDGSMRFLWITDQIGGQALKKAGEIPEVLEQNGVRLKNKPLVIKTIGMSSGRGLIKSSRIKKLFYVYLMIWIVPIFLLLGFAWF